jgi:3-dehydroquinate synthase
MRSREVWSPIDSAAETRAGSDAPAGAQASPVMVQRIQVAFEYPVFFTEHAFQYGNTTLVRALSRSGPPRRHRLYVVIDDGVASAWPSLRTDIEQYVDRHAQTLQLAGEPMVLTGGEAVKNSDDTCALLQARMHALGIDRHSYLVAIGGGAFLDMAGFAAATAHRGVRLVRMPTTVLGQDDSGVGVKNGINAFGVKNFLGTFAPPYAVVNDIAFLSTLSPRDRIAGMAEAVKVALIRDARFFDWLEGHAAALTRFDRTPVANLVRRAAELHLQHIAQGGDPFELGSARPLDFGHWAAHKLEALTDHALRHGEAVAIGMALDSRCSQQRGWLTSDGLERICTLLERLGFRLWDPALGRRTASGDLAILRGLEEFREHLGGELTVTLLTGIGCTRDVHAIEAVEVERAVAWLEARDRARMPP